MSRSPRKHPDARSADRALRHFRGAVREGRVIVDPRVYNRLHELGISRWDLTGKIAAMAEEICASVARPVSGSFDPPGHAFVFQSKEFGMPVYLRFRLEGKKPVVKLYSLHPPDYSE